MAMPFQAGKVMLTAALGAAVIAGASSAVVAAPDRDRFVLGDTAVELWEGRGLHGAATEFYQVTIGDRTSGPREARFELMLRDRTIDPLLDPQPAIAPELAADADVNMWIVQYETQPLDAYADALAASGATIRWFVPYQAAAVEMDAAAAAAVADLPFVRWMGPLHPEYRIDGPVRDALLVDALVPDEYNIMVWEGGLGMKTAVAQAIRGVGGEVTQLDAGKYLLRAVLDADQVAAIAFLDEVAFIDQYGPLEPDMNIARSLMGANYLESMTGYTGQGVVGEVIDVGFNLSHNDFNHHELIVHGSVSTASHGASTSGIIFGDGTGSADARGLVPDGQGIVADTVFMEGVNRYNDLQQLLNPPYEGSFQSSSVGSPRTFFYTSESASMDAALFDLDIVVCQSQSNAGNQDSRPQAWAKNIISVGGVNHLNTETTSDDFWSGASIGPASDGRIKPDLNSFYDNIRTVTSGGVAAYTNNFGGTSGATPIVAGYVGLFHQMWSEGIFGNTVDPSGSVFDNRPHMTTTKAMMINTAWQYTFTGATHNLTRTHQGWGMPDLQTMYDLREQMLIVNEDDVLLPLQSRIHTATVLAGAPAFRATMVYADPPAAPPFSGLHRINDLSLKVTSPGGTEYWGNNGLHTGNWSAPGGSNNDVDTVENVLVQNPEPGLWTIEVIAFEINQDSHVETPETDADYALVVSGVIPQLPPVLMRLLSPIPSLVPEGVPFEVSAEILDGDEALDAGSPTLHYRLDSGSAYETVAMVHTGDGVYVAEVPGAPCDSAPEFYMSASTVTGVEVFLPQGAPESVYGYNIGEDAVIFTDDFETDTGWTVQSTDLAAGEWERAVPMGGGDRRDPEFDYDGSGQCYVTGPEDGDTDVDGGPTILYSPVWDLTAYPDPMIEYARWFSCDDAGVIPSQEDFLTIEISPDGGSTWQEVEVVESSSNWVVAQVRVWDFFAPTETVQMRFIAVDNPSNSLTEAGIDAVTIGSFVCGSCTPTDGDTNGDGAVDVEDLLTVLGSWGACGDPCPADVNCDGDVTVSDLLEVLANWS